jgi:hypothetical protein
MGIRHSTIHPSMNAAQHLTPVKKWIHKNLVVCPLFPGPVERTLAIMVHKMTKARLEMRK